MTLKPILTLAVSASLLLGACGSGDSTKTPPISRSASASDIRNVCIGVTHQNLEAAQTIIDASEKMAREKKILDGKRKKGLALMEKMAKDVQTTSARTCCGELRKDASRFNRDQRTMLYHGLVRSNFNLTPNQSKQAGEYLQAARDDLTFDKAALVSKAQFGMGTCMNRVKREVEAKYQKSAEKLMKS